MAKATMDVVLEVIKEYSDEIASLQEKAKGVVIELRLSGNEEAAHTMEQLSYIVQAFCTKVKVK